MNLTFVLSIYFVVWWTVLLAILPLGVRSHHSAGLEVPGGGEPGSPVDPKLGRKFLTTTWVSAVVCLVIWAVWSLHILHLPDLPSS